MRRAVAALGVVAIVTACAPEPEAPRPIPEAATDCGVAASFSCNLPYPSDTWLVPDPSTPTGVRMRVPENAVGPEVLAMFGERDQIVEAEVDADGFSSISPVALQLPDALPDDAVPADGGDVVQAWDVTTGERLRIHVEVSQHLNDERGLHNIIVVYPATRWEPTHRIFVGVLPGVKTFHGGPAKASGSKAWASAETRAAAARFTPSVSWGDYLAATSFIVRSDESFAADVDRMVEEVRSADLRFRNVGVQPSLVGGSLMVTGEVSTLDFREADGAILRDGSAHGREQWLNFLLALPERPATDKGAPVIIYGHGIIAMKETMIAISHQATARGYAVIAIDKPNHGSRSGLDGGHIGELVWPQNFARLQSLLLQSILDDIALVNALKQHGRDIDVAPAELFGNVGDGIPDLDTDSIHYIGTSLGGVLGGSVVGLEPAIDGAYLQVPGSGIIDILFHSMVWGMFQSVVPGNAVYGDNHALTFFAQNLLDRADSANWLGRIRERGTPVFISYGLNDGLVRNTATERMAELLGLPFVGPMYAPLPETLAANRVEEMPADGRGFHQVPTDEIPESFLKPLLTHVAFLDPLSVRTLEQWLDGRLVEIRSRQ